MLDVSKDGDALILRLKRGVSLRDATLEATITMPELETLTLSGASAGSVSGFRSSDRLDIALSGASSLDGGLEAVDTRINASGASRVVLEGSATEMVIVGSGASKLNLGDFAADTARVTLSGASEATVNALDRIDPVDVTGASTLRYRGDPNFGRVHTSGASTVEGIGD